MGDLPVDLYGYGTARTRVLGPRPQPDMWQPVVIDDWPGRIPVTEAELDVFEAYFEDILDGLLGRSG